MGKPEWWERIKDTVSDAQKSELRDLTENDRDRWDAALDAREASPMKPRTREDVRELIRKADPVRWWQIKRDFKWLEKQMKKLGLNPEDARYIL